MTWVLCSPTCVDLILAFVNKGLHNLEHTFNEFGLKIQFNARLYNTMLL